MPVFFILMAVVIVLILILMLPIYGKIGGFVLHLFGIEDNSDKDEEDKENS